MRSRFLLRKADVDRTTPLITARDLIQPFIRGTQNCIDMPNRLSLTDLLVPDDYAQT
jgi:hypothetical protein